MRERKTAQIWNICGYVRLSREDGDKEVSNSVTGQKALIRDYMVHHPELRECGTKVDDGYTESNYYIGRSRWTAPKLSERTEYIETAETGNPGGNPKD